MNIFKKRVKIQKKAKNKFVTSYESKYFADTFVKNIDITNMHGTYQYLKLDGKMEAIKKLANYINMIAGEHIIDINIVSSYLRNK